LAAVLVVTCVLSLAPRVAAAASLHAVPATVRVNVTPNGVGYTVVSSSGTLTATRADGALVYRGRERLLVRTNVRRAEGVPLSLPPRPDALTPDERADRRRLLHEARSAELEARSQPASIVTTPFEISLLRDLDDPQGEPLHSADKVGVVTFTTDGILAVNGRGFRGVLETTVDDDGEAIIVNTVATGVYLASVVGSEEPSSWEPQALAAQAIAARTYLLTHLRRHDHYDLEGDTRDQEYDGVANEVRSTVRAVELTAGIVATYRGAAIEALYSANAGGITEDSENVFTNALPYLRSVPSPADEVAKSSAFGRSSWEWEREFTAPMLGDYMRARGLDVGTPTKIEVLRKSATGRPLLTRVTGTLGSRDIGMERARYYFGLKSNLFTPTQQPSEQQWVDAGDIERLRDMAALGARKLRSNRDVSFDDTGRRRGMVVTEILFALPARFSFVGRGFGHSVGMSQWGAQGMALGGASYEQILKHYYTGIALTNVGGP
ncbi:MAG TPA: SpoIID/LytB domain-containing protein, partial [Candidatus Limnocylindria bacterium]|nr:SpoIID/LytB domain-containing protein [Candidatus Limnocylindria bacterium]